MNPLFKKIIEALRFKGKMEEMEEVHDNASTFMYLNFQNK